MGVGKMTDILQTALSIAFLWLKMFKFDQFVYRILMPISLKFVPSSPIADRSTLVHVWLGDEYTTSHYPNWCWHRCMTSYMASLPTGVIRHQPWLPMLVELCNENIAKSLMHQQCHMLEFDIWVYAILLGKHLNSPILLNCCTNITRPWLVSNFTLNDTCISLSQNTFTTSFHLKLCKHVVMRKVSIRLSQPTFIPTLNK